MSFFAPASANAVRQLSPSSSAPQASVRVTSKDHGPGDWSYAKAALTIEPLPRGLIRHPDLAAMADRAAAILMGDAAVLTACVGTHPNVDPITFPAFNVYAVRARGALDWVCTLAVTAGVGWADLTAALTAAGVDLQGAEPQRGAA